VKDRQKGSHLTMRHPDTGVRVVIPMHPGDMAVGLIHDILARAGLSVEGFLALLK
jgi:predicted RNA binding protein YcfA (HicA-like mRNA interferase family)